jgi:hypothetical protein
MYHGVICVPLHNGVDVHIYNQSAFMVALMAAAGIALFSTPNFVGFLER